MSRFDLAEVLETGLSIDDAQRTVSVIPRLKPKDYASVKAVLTRLGGVWKSSAQHFTFPKSPQSLIDRVLSVGTRRLNQFHFYPTPVEVFDYMREHTDLSFFGASESSTKVLEPSCGEGALIRYLREFGEEEGRHFDIDAYDIDPLNVIFCEEAGIAVEQADFLSVEPRPEYDMVVMNPPFNGDEYIKHIRHAQQFLKPLGLLLAVVPTTWITSSDKKDRAWLLEQAQILSSSDLPEGNWFEAGTFDGVAIPTIVIQLGSASAAETTLSSDRYKGSACLDFQLFIDNTESLSNRLSAVRGMEFTEGQNEIAAVVDEALSGKFNETAHLVRRYRQIYIKQLSAQFLAEEPTRTPMAFGAMLQDQLSLMELEPA